jgi:hypothetical protein
MLPPMLRTPSSFKDARFEKTAGDKDSTWLWLSRSLVKCDGKTTPSNDTMLLLARSRVLRDPGQTTPLNDSSLFSLRSSTTNDEGNTTPDNDLMAFPRRIRVVTADTLSKLGAGTEVMFKLYRVSSVSLSQ